MTILDAPAIAALPAPDPAIWEGKAAGYIILQFRLRLSRRTESIVRRALRRYHHGLQQALQAARARQRELLRCIVPKETRRGTRLVVDGPRLHALVLGLVPRLPALHSSARSSMLVDVEGQLSSWLGLYIDWIERGRPAGEKPAFPSVRPSDARRAMLLWQARLMEAPALGADLAAENRWRAEAMRAPSGRPRPYYFGAMGSGIDGDAFAGLLWRPGDRRLFALLTLLPAGDRRGRPTQIARNRLHAGPVYNVRALEKRGEPRKGAGKCSLMVPLEFGRGHLDLLRRGRPKSAHLVERGDGYALHVAVELPRATPVEGDHILAVQRGITTLVAAAVVSPAGELVATRRIDGRDLARLIAAIQRERAARQRRGRSTRGDRRAARVAEHHVASAVQQLLDLARERRVGRIVLLSDRRMRQPTPFLAWRHWAAIRERLAQRTVAIHSGVRYPAPEERALYGSRRVCPACGCDPRTLSPEALAERGEGPQAQCPGCGRQRQPDVDAAWLLALDALRFSRHTDNERRPSLADFIRELRRERAGA